MADIDSPPLAFWDALGCKAGGLEAHSQTMTIVHMHAFATVLLKAQVKVAGRAGLGQVWPCVTGAIYAVAPVANCVYACLLVHVDWCLQSPKCAIETMVIWCVQPCPLCLGSACKHKMQSGTSRRMLGVNLAE